ncbi:D-isomer specific 2-hydroxyacid dehydrogenase [Collybia nuda]|uniref:D-isomer specific 2-hydroxyacid dehydrogenase n=1 Tax=Collybia nuda TaxID=64659 RepID=A0A9P6CC62_9AGAR|nr:D-isomer specific 2-hydroxyacid dehydrogenase [Collybia nuda]
MVVCHNYEVLVVPLREVGSQNQAGFRPKVVVTRNLGPDVMPLLYERSDLDLVLWPEDRVADRSWLLENIPGAAGVLVMITEKVDKELLEAAGPSLKVASTMSVGYEHADLSELGKRGIKFGYTPDVLTDAVADLSVMLALMAGRNAGQVITLVQDSKWPASPWAPFAFCGPQLSTTPISAKRTVGFLGFGRISQATLARLVPFGITDCVYSSNPTSQPTPSRDEALAKKHGLKSLRRVNVDELARESDVLFVLAPGGPTTRHLVNEEFLKKMKKTSILVNTSRGTLVDSDALGKALREGWIWGAGLDVVEGEPHIAADHVLVKEPRCVVLPHIGSATLETRVGMATLAVQNLLAALDGKEMPASIDLSNRS